MIVPVILSGGSGSRLWPLSRSLNPKQFLQLCGEQTMLQETILRLNGVEELADSVVVCNEAHRFIVAEQFRNIELELELDKIILEPEARNTAPAIAAAANYLLDKDPVMLVLAADHVIENIDAFHEAIQTGKQLAEQGKLVTFGIVPDKAETGYGYIKRGSLQEDGKEQLKGQAYKVEKFVEKPNKETASVYLESGEYYWNSGMFMFKASAILQELSTLSPDIFKAVKLAVEKGKKEEDFCRLEQKAFSASPSDSIDYAVMEKTDKSVVVPLDANWSDVGSWDAIWDIQTKDSQGNIFKGDILSHEVSNSYIHAEERMVAVIGMDNCIVVETADAVLVADKDKSQQVKKIVNQLKARSCPSTILHQKVYRPWGSYETLVETDRFKVKRIIVKPNEQLSLQKHHHRAEHWVIVKGTALIHCGEDEVLLKEDESTYIPIATTHRLKNPGVIPLELIEIQTGSYLGEDDIVRFEDNYGRNIELSEGAV